MIWFAVFFAPTLLTTVVLLERLERQLLADRPDRHDRSDLATVIQIAYPHLVERAGRPEAAVSHR